MGIGSEASCAMGGLSTGSNAVQRWHSIVTSATTPIAVIGWRTPFFRCGSPGEFAVKVAGTFTANSPGAVAQMALGGLGIARCPHYVVASALEDGRLEQLLATFKTDEFGLPELNDKIDF